MVPPAVVTSTLLAPALPAGVVAVIVVALVTTTLVAATPPTVTPVAVPSPVPVIVILVPPDPEPKEGLTLVKVGGASKSDGEGGLVQTLPFMGLYNTAGGAGTTTDQTTLSMQDSAA